MTVNFAMDSNSVKPSPPKALVLILRNFDDLVEQYRLSTLSSSTSTCPLVPPDEHFKHLNDNDSGKPIIEIPMKLR